MSEMTQQPMTAADMKELLRSRYGSENKNEFDIHVEKETERKIVDWERTYFLTKYYMA